MKIIIKIKYNYFSNYMTIGHQIIRQKNSRLKNAIYFLPNPYLMTH